MASSLDIRLFEFCKTFVYEFETKLDAYQNILDHKTEKSGKIAGMLLPLVGASAAFLASFATVLVSRF